MRRKVPARQWEWRAIVANARTSWEGWRTGTAVRGGYWVRLAVVCALYFGAAGVVWALQRLGGIPDPEARTRAPEGTAVWLGIATQAPSAAKVSP